MALGKQGRVEFQVNVLKYINLHTFFICNNL
uniref:Uncharacterized protein n=1 Tax=Anguilla anguilla TaxID=7936 RepID=A0A0E9P7U8_ANGAN